MPDRASTMAKVQQTSETRTFHRAYKVQTHACLVCRKKKTKCVISAEEYTAGDPCTKCRREMRECIFTAERYGREHAAETILKNRRRNEKEVSIHLQDTLQTAAPNSARELSCRPDESSDFSPNFSQTTSMLLRDRPPGGSLASTCGEPQGLVEPIMRAVVSNEKDALNILFEAAQHESDLHNLDSVGEDDVSPSQTSHTENTTTSDSISIVLNGGSYRDVPQTGNTNIRDGPRDEVLRVWNAYRFVAMGWLSAEEALMLIDAFFQNMAPLSPILDEFYAEHANHYQLVTREPFLCCMILTISSRYHTLPSAGGISRGYMLHQRLWDHCQHLLLRLLLGQEKNSKARIRTLGSIEALLLLVEWHPRSLLVPPASDGWDSDVLLTVINDRDESSVDVDSPSRSRWKEDVIKPAKRLDQMSWMVLGCASSLMMEIAIPSGDDDGKVHESGGYGKRLQARRLPIVRLVTLFQEQLASRLGNRSMIPEGLSHMILSLNSSTRKHEDHDSDWDAFMSAWNELNKLEKSISHTMFPSCVVTRHLLQSGRYFGMIDHFRPLLSDWKDRFLDTSRFRRSFSETLLVEYSSIRIYTNSLGLQAIVEKSITDADNGITNGTLDMDPADYSCIREVLDACLDIFKATIRLAESESLKFAPARLFLRITTASVFLLKALGLGAGNSQLEDSLTLLSRATAAVKTCKPDDVHLGAQYAALLDAHMTRLREKFIPTVRPPFIDYSQSAAGMRQDIMGQSSTGWQAELNATIQDLDPMVLTGIDESWLSLPIESSLQPFVLGDSPGPEWLHPHALDFIWNTNP